VPPGLLIFVTPKSTSQTAEKLVLGPYLGKGTTSVVPLSRSKFVRALAPGVRKFGLVLFFRSLFRRRGICLGELFISVNAAPKNTSARDVAPGPTNNISLLRRANRRAKLRLSPRLRPALRRVFPSSGPRRLRARIHCRLRNADGLLRARTRQRGLVVARVRAHFLVVGKQRSGHT
jgi:hypothetical protein